MFRVVKCPNANFSINIYIDKESILKSTSRCDIVHVWTKSDDREVKELAS